MGQILDKTILIIGKGSEAHMYFRSLQVEGKKAKIIYRLENIQGCSGDDYELHMVWGHSINQDFAAIFDYARSHSIETKRVD